jgi:hypothetical protein
MSGIRPLFLRSLFFPGLVLLGAILQPGAFARAQNQPGDPPGGNSGLRAVTVDDLKKWLYTLASPEFEGRGTGTEGFRKAAEFMRDQYQSLGLEPAGDQGSFFQKVTTIVAPKVDDKKTSLTFHKGEQTVAVPCERLGGGVSKGLSGKGDVVLVTTADPAAIDKLDLKDKIVLLLMNDESQRERINALSKLAERGAAATVIATHAPVESKLESRRSGRGRAMRGAQMLPPLVEFGGDDFAKVLTLAGVDLKTVSPPMTPLAGVTAEFAVALTESDAPTWNVCAVLRGSDPKVAGEYVVVGSHLDHLGKRGSTWFPGADDDGSGSTGVVALAHMFAANRLHPRRSILFLNFCGEELGLLGSAFYSEHPTVPLESIVGELQMDMIGRDEEEGYDGPRLVNKGEKAEDNLNSLHLVGSKKLSTELHAICMQKNETAKFDLEWDEERMFNRSDHANFARMGVPIAFFFTGLHRDYHQPTDTPDKIDFPKLLRVVQYVHDIALDLAERDDRPHVDPELWDAYQGKSREKPAAPLTPPPPRKPGEGR